ncbi:Uncharacterised protein [Mycobacteroides abscessus subsp. abscessus]|nr:Uncharacterised protein [Mycobacteroides abscessus subsp. abscessus]
MRVCAEPNCPTLIPKAGRCPAHRIDSPTTYQRSNPERKRRARAVAEHVARLGWVCPGYGVPAHESRDLTADHVLAVANGGGDGALAVLCRPCNSRKGAR